jgi:biopolymer transport protein TolQ
MILLVTASIWSWSIMIQKSRSFRNQRNLTNLFEERFWSQESLDDFYDHLGSEPDGALARVFGVGMREWRMASTKGVPRSLGRELRTSLVGRIEKSMSLVISKEMDELEKGIPFLASVGSVAPFIGLFGTVWGIMNSFAAIAESKNTSLAVVAPGIAEALFATALGLAAAIPAVVAYNKFSGDLEKIGNSLESFAAEFTNLIARQLDEDAS